MNTAYSVMLVIFCSAATARASFEDLEARAQAYRESGQAARDHAAEQAKAAKAAIPEENRLYMKDINHFAQRYGGISGKPRLSFDTAGSIAQVEFLTKLQMKCQAQFARMTCIDVTTLDQYDYEPHLPSGWGPGWRRK